MESSLDIILKLVDKASGGINSVRSAMGNLESKAQNAQNKLSPLTNLFGTALKAGAVAGTAAIGGLAAGIYDATMRAASMEQEVADIASVMGSSAEAIEPLKNLIQDLGMDPRLKVSAEEAADAIEMLVKNGLDMQQVMDGAARNTVLLANATGADFGTAADIATDVMALFNIEAKDMMTAVNGITGTTVKSKFDINSYRLALAQAGGVAAASGVEFDDFNAVIAAISPSFASGSDAGTSFKTFLQRLVPDTAPAIDALRELGLYGTDWGAIARKLSGILGKEVGPSSAEVAKAFNELAIQQGISTDDTKAMSKAWEELSDGLTTNAFFDASGNMKSMAEISQLLHDATKDLTEEQRLQAMGTIFGTDAMRAANAVAGMTAESFTQLKNEIGKVDAEEAAKTRMDTLKGSLEILQGVFDGLRLSIGDKFLPIFKSMVDRFTEFLSANSDRIVGWAESFANRLDELIPAAEATLNWMIRFVTTGEEMNVSQMGLSEENVKLVSQFIGFFNTIKDLVVQVADFVESIGGLKTILTSMGILMGISVAAQVITFVGSIVSAFTAVSSFVGALTGVGPLLAALTPLFGPVGIAVAAIGAAIYALYLAWDNNWLGIRDITNRSIETVKGWISSLPGWLSGLWSSVSTNAQTLMSKIGEGFNIGKEAAKNIISGAVNWLTQSLGTDLNTMGAKIGEGAKTAFSTIGTAFGAVKETIKATISTYMNDVKEHGWSYATGAMAGRLFEGAKTAFSKFIEGFTASSPTGISQISGILWKIIDEFNRIMDNFKTHVFDVMKNVGFNLVNGLTTGISQLMVNIQSTIQRLTEMIPQWVRDQLGIHSDSRVMIELGEYTMSGFATGLRRMMRQPLETVRDLTNSLGSEMSDFANSTSNYSYSTVSNTNFNVALPVGVESDTASQVQRTVNTLASIYGKGY